MPLSWTVVVLELLILGGIVAQKKSGRWTPETRRILQRLTGIFLIALILWALAGLALYNYPVPGSDDKAFEKRGQFGDMFGAVSCLLSAITLGLIAYSTWDATNRQTYSDRWRINYEYLRDAKRLIVEHPEILELHGVSSEILGRVVCRDDNGEYVPLKLRPEGTLTSAQVAYVVLDMKAADLFYKMLREDRPQLTEYRQHLLQQPQYQQMVRDVIIPGQFIDGDFIKLVDEYLNEIRASNSPRRGSA
jgi:hypothetical protein